jgi:hypothetical protein
MQKPNNRGKIRSKTLAGVQTALAIQLIGIMALTGCSGLTSPARKAPPEITSAMAQQAVKIETRRFDQLPLLEPQPEAAQIAPGLQVMYFNEFYKRHLRFLPRGEKARREGWTGKPITYLDHEFGKGVVFGSGVTQGIGMRLTGLIWLEKAGLYRWQALSNDGVRVYLSGQMIIDDPDVHKNRLSNIAEVEIQTAGWYPLWVEYFQRKGSAALSLRWQPPGADAWTAIPAKVYAHQLAE